MKSKSFALMRPSFAITTAVFLLSAAGCNPFAPERTPLEATGSWYGHLKQITATRPDTNVAYVTALVVDGGAPVVADDKAYAVAPGTVILLTDRGGRLINWNAKNVATAPVTVYGFWSDRVGRPKFLESGFDVTFADTNLANASIKVRRIATAKIPSTKPAATKPSTEPAHASAR